MTAGTWTEDVRIPSYHVTPQGTASVLALADYFQEAAGRHAAELGVSMRDLQAEGRAWVLAHFQLEIDRLPEWEEHIRLETWPSGLDALFATREVLYRDRDGVEIARGTSAWLVIDTDKRQPLRPPDALYDIDVPDRDAPIVWDREDLSIPDEIDGEQRFHVRYHDLDLNRHVNNVRYLEWAIETLSHDILDERRCAAVTLQFEAEATLGDPVRALAQLMDDGDPLLVRHQLVHAESNRTLAVAETEWRREGDSAR